MSYGATENVAEDVDVLEGATIEKVMFADWDDGFEVIKKGVVRIRVRYRPELRVNGKTHGEYEIWADPEGNGPGYLCFVQEG